MSASVSELLGPWENFYVISGSAAAGLTGLMFVVITLIKDARRVRQSPNGLSAFSTPTVVHFSAALFIAALLSMPWHSLIVFAAALIAIGFAGSAYAALLMHKARQISTYTPDLEDWTWYWILPLVAYLVILISAMVLFYEPRTALFGFAASSLLLIFIGIHNAWDIVTFLAVATNDDDEES